MRRTAILLVLLAVTSAARAEFDGRLPAGIGEPIDPAGPYPPNAQEFFATRPGQFLVYWDEVLDTPRYLSPRSEVFLSADPGPLQPSGADTLEHLTRGFVDQHARFFGVDSRDLSGPLILPIGDDWLVVYGQMVGGIAVRGAALRFFVRDDGQVRAIKAYLLRDAPSPNDLPTWGDAASVLARIPADYEVIDLERQFLFPTGDPAHAVPIWRTEVESADGPLELFSPIGGGDVFESRRFVFELGIIPGTFTAEYPNPDKEHPNFLFQTPDQMAAHPVIDAMIRTNIDTVFTEEDGTFEVVAEGPTADVDWVLKSGECLDSQVIDGFDICPQLPETILERIVTMDPSFECTVKGVFADSDDVVFPVGAPIAIHLNERRDVVLSARLMAFRHATLFLNEASDNINRAGVDTIGLPALAVSIHGRVQGERHYFASRQSPLVCFTHQIPLSDDAAQQDPGGPRQWLTPTLLYHEIAHHVIFDLTGYRESRAFDCLPQDRDRFGDCVDRNSTTPERRDLSFVEGVTDAFAAYQSRTPKFGFMSEGHVAGPLAYDISIEDNRIRDPIRRVTAKLLWDIREQFLSVVSPGPAFERRLKEAHEAALNLLYRWIALQRCTGSEALGFELGPCLLDELLDVDGGAHADKILPVFDEHPFLVRVPFIRGDANQDGRTSISDAVTILSHLFLKGPDPTCPDAMDANDSGTLNLTDPVVILNHLFLGGEPVAPPTMACGLDPTFDSLTCDRQGFCGRF